MWICRSNFFDLLTFDFYCLKKEKEKRNKHICLWDDCLKLVRVFKLLE